MPTALDRLDPARRGALVQAAAEEFARAGIEGASLNRIIRACGMSKSSFYHVFDTRADLVNLVIGDLAAQVRSGVAIPAPETFSEEFWCRVERFLSRLERDLLAHPDALLLGRIFYATPAGGAQEGVVADISAWVADVLHAGRQVGAVRSDQPADLQLALVVAVVRTMDEWALREIGDGFGDAGSAPALTEVLERLLAP
ncbi:TetR/AcrR family transcriptional regulator [Ruania suaedae]|uniref:TetR/AcrR family transcriptional regulator n=1 Tax=Ruania suaedae TaxID=2897774 RepID=UPI001E29D8E1|nr:TetR/AcrR family transcriptional regulator [Ruania suaedae]UFU02747.1 TetR/AcrR family transcriptional regulator [Ruania suaedae]